MIDKASSAGTLIKERVKALTTLFTASTQPLTIALDSFSLVLVLPQEERTEWQDKGLLPFSPHELAWLVAGKEQLGKSIDLTLLLRVFAGAAIVVLPS